MQVQLSLTQNWEIDRQTIAVLTPIAEFLEQLKDLLASSSGEAIDSRSCSSTEISSVRCKMRVAPQGQSFLTIAPIIGNGQVSRERFF